MLRDKPETRVHASAGDYASPIDWVNDLIKHRPSNAKELLTAYFDDVNNCKQVLLDPKFDLEILEKVCVIFKLSLHYYYTFDRAHELKTILEAVNNDNLDSALDNALRMGNDINLALQNEELLASRYAEFKQGLFSALAADLCLSLLEDKRKLALATSEVNQSYIKLLNIFTNAIEILVQILQNKALEDELNNEEAKALTGESLNREKQLATEDKVNDEEAVFITRTGPDDTKVNYSSDIERHLNAAIHEYPDNIPETLVSSPGSKDRTSNPSCSTLPDLPELVMQGPSLRDTDKGKGKEKDYAKEKEEETPRPTSYRQSHSLFPERHKSRSYAPAISHYSLESVLDDLPQLTIQGHDKENRIDLTTLSEEEQMEIAIRRSLEEQENLEQRGEDSPSMRRR